MKRGDIYWVDFDPGIGGEIRKKRPAVIVSENTANQYLKRVQVVPFTSNNNKLYPSEVVVQIGNKTSKAMADQITTIDKQRLGDFIQSLSAVELQAIDVILKRQLGLL